MSDEFYVYPLGIYIHAYAHMCVCFLGCLWVMIGGFAFDYLGKPNIIC